MDIKNSYFVKSKSVQTLYIYLPIKTRRLEAHSLGTPKLDKPMYLTT